MVSICTGMRAFFSPRGFHDGKVMLPIMPNRYVGIIFPLQSFGSLCCGHGLEFGRRVKGSTPIQQQSCRKNYCSIWSRAFRKCMQSVVQRLARSPLSRKRAPGIDSTFARNYYIRIYSCFYVLPSWRILSESAATRPTARR